MTENIKPTKKSSAWPVFLAILIACIVWLQFTTLIKLNELESVETEYVLDEQYVEPSAEGDTIVLGQPANLKRAFGVNYTEQLDTSPPIDLRFIYFSPARECFYTKSDDGTVMELHFILVKELTGVLYSTEGGY